MRSRRFFRTEAPGTIIITPKVPLPGSRQQPAFRYGIGVGREGFTWSGLQKIARKVTAGLASAAGMRAPAPFAAVRPRSAPARRAISGGRSHHHEPAADDRTRSSGCFCERRRDRLTTACRWHEGDHRPSLFRWRRLTATEADCPWQDDPDPALAAAQVQRAAQSQTLKTVQDRGRSLRCQSRPGGLCRD